jgi:hypothetical protein
MKIQIARSASAVQMTQLPWDADVSTLAVTMVREVDEIELAARNLPIQSQHPMQLTRRSRHES